MIKAPVLLVALAAGLASCRNDLRQVDAINAKVTNEDRAQDVTLIFSKGGHVEARLFAKEFVRAERAKPPYTDARKSLRMEFYDTALRVQNTVTARYARWYEGKGNVLLRDSVKVRNNKGEELQTDELVWNETAKKFYTEKPVRITTPTQTLAGTGLEANQNFTWYRIIALKGQVKVDKGAVPAD